MKIDLVSLNASCAYCPKVDHNKRFIKMVRIITMLSDKGG